jgi:hypothetical protein
VITYEILAAPPLLVQLHALRAAFPGWDIMVAGFGAERWFEASRSGYTGPGPCTLVAGTVPDMRRALSAANGISLPHRSTKASSSRQRFLGLRSSRQEGGT